MKKILLACVMSVTLAGGAFAAGAAGASSGASSFASGGSAVIGGSNSLTAAGSFGNASSSSASVSVPGGTIATSTSHQDGFSGGFNLGLGGGAFTAGNAQGASSSAHSGAIGVHF
jgi:hypothetical protein